VRYNIGAEDSVFFSENRKHDNAVLNAATERSSLANFQIMPRRSRQRSSDPSRNVSLVSDVVEKNIDSSSKSNPLRRRRENYDASTWRRMRRRRKNESRRTFNKNHYDLLTAINELLIVHSRSIFRYMITDWLANYMIPTMNLCFAVRSIIETKTKCARAVIYSVELCKWLRIIWVGLGLYFCVLLDDRTVH